MTKPPYQTLVAFQSLVTPNATSIPTDIANQQQLALDTATEIIDSWTGQEFSLVTTTKIFDAPVSTVLFIPSINSLSTIKLRGITQGIDTYKLIEDDTNPGYYNRIERIDPATGDTILWYDPEVSIDQPDDLIEISGTWWTTTPARIVTACQTIASILYNMAKKQYAMVGGNRITGIQMESLGKGSGSGDLLTDEFLQILLNDFIRKSPRTIIPRVISPTGV